MLMYGAGAEVYRWPNNKKLSPMEGEKAMFDNVMSQLDAMAAELADRNYDGKHAKVWGIIQDARCALTKEKGKLGPWEAEELEYAENAVRNNFLMLALTATDKALAVSQLPSDEYDYGFNYTKAEK